MAFETEADRTNAVAGALTVLLRNHLPGGKPVLIVTANKSHAGKDTVITFAAGTAGSISISYQATNWAVERNFVGAIKSNPDVGVVVIENARLDRGDRFLASAFLERFATDPEPLLFSTGTGPPVRRRNDIVLAISTNFGCVSEDLMNRGLPVHLNPVGNVADRVSPIGNPRLEYLPANRERIAAELRGMVERWKAAGQPLDEDVRHPFSVWAKRVGGILRVNGFRGFLGNYGVRKTVDDPLRQGSRTPWGASPGRMAPGCGLGEARLGPWAGQGGDPSRRPGQRGGACKGTRGRAQGSQRRDLPDRNRDQEAHPATGVATRAIPGQRCPGAIPVRAGRSGGSPAQRDFFKFFLRPGNFCQKFDPF